LGVVNIVETESIEGLPVGAILEEVSLFGPSEDGPGQIVLLHAKVEKVEEAGRIGFRRILFETDRTGATIGEEKLSGVERITYMQRS
jgi:hypothetical protein